MAHYTLSNTNSKHFRTKHLQVLLENVVLINNAIENDIVFNEN